MQKQIILTDTNEYMDGIFEIMVTDDKNYSITIYVGDNTTIEHRLNDKKSFDECINHEYVLADDTKLLDMLKSNFDYILDLVDYVRFDFEKMDELEYLNNNPILKNKKIVTSDVFRITDYEKITDLDKKYSDYSNMYVILEGNINYVSIDDAKKTINIMNNYINQIKAFHLSPLEQIMYTYDLVKNRIYTKEDSLDDALVSRDLSQILLSDKIVCVGYTTLFETILSYLGIKSIRLNIQEKETLERHVRNVVYIKDNKYNVDGIYCFDATWDSRRHEDGKKYINRYQYFAKTINEMKFLENNKYKYENIYYSENMYMEAKKALKGNTMLDNKCLEIFQTLDKFYLIIDDNAASDEYNSFFQKALLHNYSNLDDILKDINIIINKLNKPLNAETFITLVRNVRRIEYYLNPDLYPYTAIDICSAGLNAKFQFIDHIYNTSEKILMCLFGDSSHTLSDDLKNYYTDHKNEIEEDAKRVEFTKVLRKIYESKK